ncbi:hypothetical protein ACFPOE_19625 [Caenimonas terrae]|uniref:Uncharacterized protein n=1 Tax=Caenimonas terrae TaxID=696074 RepID=A0ABW0NK58_9BURK
MGITLMTFSGLFAPLQQLAGWLASAPARPPQRVGRMVAAPAAACGKGPGRARPTWRPAVRNVLPARRPLRVVRVEDGAHASAAAGRMVISGRMADVCAELDRLAAQEAGRVR